MDSQHVDGFFHSKILEISGHEPTTCLKKVEAYLALLVFTSATLIIKRYFFRPVLESHLKKKYAAHLHSRRHRLHDLLSDPMLLVGLERELERRYNGDKQRVSLDLENLRLLAETQVTEVYEDTKGDEKEQAAYVMLIGTAILSVLILLLFSIYNLFVQMRMDFEAAFMLQLKQDLCGDKQTVDSFFPYATYVFLLFHFVDCIIMVAMLPGIRRKRTVNGGSDHDVETTTVC